MPSVYCLHKPLVAVPEDLEQRSGICRCLAVLPRAWIQALDRIPILTGFWGGFFESSAPGSDGASPVPPEGLDPGPR